MAKRNYIPNPTGKGGFGDNPENRANGRWRKEDSIPYWQRYFLTISIKEFNEYPKVNSDMTKAQEIAYNTIKNAKDDLPYIKEVTDRTSGKAEQHIDHTSKGEKITIPPLKFADE